MKINVLVVDDNVELVGLIKKYFCSSSNINIVDVAYDGIDAIEKLKSRNDIDLILLDLVMPRKDGLSVLKYIKDNNLNIKTFVMTSYSNDEFIHEIMKYGVLFYILKPFDLNDMEERINEVFINKDKNKRIIDLGNYSLQTEVTKLLHNLGIPSNIKGYQFIRTAILMVYENPNLIGGITKELYPNISVKFNTSTQRVERAIRHAIEVSWLRGDIDLMEEIFGHSVDIDRAKPTNSEFIVTIADKLRLDSLV